ncbi:hypothetical protein CYMTET_46546 [Cymbomonas tetramitiformis]|uniref:Uncharacterized protein n=1 Tax=Cymbomonas tetramitiformis TaxID=36881 RepID=A0AAE0BW01_9CHLO|nr:hypothetical protein CYMTET_46546 [Cymbomonas tetramitiformis]
MTAQPPKVAALQDTQPPQGGGAAPHSVMHFRETKSTRKPSAAEDFGWADDVAAAAAGCDPDDFEYPALRETPQMPWPMPPKPQPKNDTENVLPVF